MHQQAVFQRHILKNPEDQYPDDSRSYEHQQVLQAAAIPPVPPVEKSVPVVFKSGAICPDRCAVQPAGNKVEDEHAQQFTQPDSEYDFTFEHHGNLGI